MPIPAILLIHRKDMPASQNRTPQLIRQLNENKNASLTQYYELITLG